MTDIVDSVTRSRMMSAIKGKDTAPELRVRTYLHAVGLRYRLHARSLPGHPDLVFPGCRIALFVHGCFWHRHPGCRFATTPSSNATFWNQKLAANVERDRLKERQLVDLGWTVLRIWECETKDEERIDELFWRIKAFCCGQSHPLYQSRQQ